MTPIESISPNRTAMAVSPAATAADRLEAAFLEQMLAYAGSQPREGAMSGGLGEGQFHSLLDREYGRLLAARVDLGLGQVDR